MAEPTEMKPKDAQGQNGGDVDPNSVSLICPFCGIDPLNVTMRFTPIPPPPNPPSLVAIYHGCSNVKCRKVICVQIVPHDWLVQRISTPMPPLGSYRRNIS